MAGFEGREIGRASALSLMAETSVARLEGIDPAVADALRNRVDMCKAALTAVLNGGPDSSLSDIENILTDVISDANFSGALTSLPEGNPLVDEFRVENPGFESFVIRRAADYLFSMPGEVLRSRDLVQKLLKERKFFQAARAWLRRPMAKSDSTDLSRAARDFLRKYRGMIFMESDLGLMAPLRHSKLSNLAMFRDDGLNEEMASVFDNLDWDQYDVRRAWVQAILQVKPDASRERLKSFYVGDEGLDSISDLIALLPEKQRGELDAKTPYRRRAVARFELHGSMSEGVVIERLASEPYQQLEGDDIRSWPRQIKELDTEVENNPQFRRLLRAVYDYVKSMDKTIEEVEMTAHFMGLVANPGQESTNAPEGAHQDGADYIVSALVVRKDNAEGGESIVYAQTPDGKMKEIYRAVLEPGEFILQADSTSGANFGENCNYYHDVTPIRPIDTAKSASRDIIGFDIKVLKRKI